MLSRIRAALRKSKVNTGQEPGSTPVRLIKIAAADKKRAKPSWIIKWAYKPGGKEIDREKLISIPIFLIGFACLILYLQARRRKREQELKDFPRYTIGVTFDTHRTKGTKYVDYEYYVNGLHYKGSEYYPSDNDSINVPGGRYFVKFSAKDATNAQILFDHRVPYSVNDVPDAGLTKLPDGK